MSLAKLPKVEELFHKLASPETSHECGVFERCIRTVLDMARFKILFTKNCHFILRIMLYRLPLLY